MKSRLVGIVAFVLVSTFVFATPASASGKIFESASSLTLTPASSGQIVYSLTQPILCPVAPCYVTLDFSASQTLGVTVSPTSITWLASEWSQQRVILVTLDANTSATHPQSVLFSTATTTNTPYYADVTERFTVNLVVPDIRPTSTPSPVSTQTENLLAVTSARDASPEYLFVGIALLGLGVVGISAQHFSRRNSSRKKMLRKAH